MNLKRFAQVVYSRRTQLGLTQTEVMDRGGPTDTTLGKIENCEWTPGTRQATLRKLDTGLQWEPGSAKRVLEGGDPTPLAAPTITDPTPTHRVPEFLPAAELAWQVVTDLADSPPDDPDRKRKLDRVVVATADTITDALLRLNVGPAARGLIYSMGHRAHEVMNKQNSTEGEGRGVEATKESDAPSKADQDQKTRSLNAAEEERLRRHLDTAIEDPELKVDSGDDSAGETGRPG